MQSLAIGARALRLMLALSLLFALAGPAVAQPERDRFYWLGEMNKASLVMLVEQGIVSPDLGGEIAQALGRVLADGERPGAVRSGDYLEIERAMAAIGGPEMSRIHSGRSRQDLLATSNRLFQRDALLRSFDELNGARQRLLALAAEHADVVMPAYTWGQQAQPFTMGHFVLAYSEALERTGGRMRDAYGRVNASPLGAAALGTSSFPVDRERLAELLGFDGVVENSFGAIHVAPIDTGAELGGIASGVALAIGTFLEYVTAQYYDPQPWIVLSDVDGRSSIMPQKRNPISLVRLRTEASRLIGQAQSYLFLAHNAGAGMIDYKGPEPQETLVALAELLADFGALASRLTVDPERALAEVHADYSTTTELADVLQREADVPFRVGHHFASELVTFARREGYGPLEFPYEEARRIYARAAADYDLEDTVLPLDEEAFRRSLSPENMVAESKGLGGPQPAEVARMLDARRTALAEDRAWVEARRAEQSRASGALEGAFEALLSR